MKPLPPSLKKKEKKKSLNEKFFSAPLKVQINRHSQSFSYATKNKFLVIARTQLKTFTLDLF